MSRVKALKETSIWEVDAVAEVVKPVHRHRIWNHLINQSDQQNRDNQGKAFSNFMPYAKWSVPLEAVSEVQKRFVHFTTKVVDRQDSAKGDTTKLLIQLQDGHLIETVIMQHHHYRTVCLSSQIGCKMGCKFCATGTMGIIGNLTAGEIIEQVVHANAISKIRNVVFMGMGEPLNNMDALTTTLDFLIDTRTFSLAPRHVTVSTVGVVKNMRRLTDSYPTVTLALSLHAPNQEVRLKIVPSASAHKFDMLLVELDHRISAWGRQPSKSREKLQVAAFGEGEEEDSSSVGSSTSTATAKDKEKGAGGTGTGTMARTFKKHSHSSGIMIEYILIKDVNVLPEHAHELGKLLSSRREDLLLNLIPYNPTDIAEDFEPPSQAEVDEFHRILISEEYRIHCRCRHEKGQDIDGACGQLVVQTKKKQEAKAHVKSVDIEDAAGGNKTLSGGLKKCKGKSNRRTGLGGADRPRTGKDGGLITLHSMVTVASIGMFAYSALLGR